MKRLLAILLLALAACASPPPAQTDQFDSSAGKALQEITLARQAFTQLATAGKISWTQDDLAQATLTAARQQIEKAQTLRLTDPAQAARLLADALTQLASYQGAPKK